MEIKVEEIKTFADERGAVFEPLSLTMLNNGPNYHDITTDEKNKSNRNNESNKSERSKDGKNTWINCHVATVEPLAIRGNHYHPTRTEILIVMGPALVRISTFPDTKIEPKKTMRFTIPPNTPHAVLGLPPHTSFLIAFLKEEEENQSFLDQHTLKHVVLDPSEIPLLLGIFEKQTGEICTESLTKSPTEGPMEKSTKNVDNCVQKNPEKGVSIQTRWLGHITPEIQEGREKRSDAFEKLREYWKSPEAEPLRAGKSFFCDPDKIIKTPTGFIVDTLDGSIMSGRYVGLFWTPGTPFPRHVANDDFGQCRELFYQARKILEEDETTRSLVGLYYDRVTGKEPF